MLFSNIWSRKKFDRDELLGKRFSIGVSKISSKRNHVFIFLKQPKIIVRASRRSETAVFSLGIQIKTLNL